MRSFITLHKTFIYKLKDFDQLLIPLYCHTLSFALRFIWVITFSLEHLKSISHSSNKRNIITLSNKQITPKDTPHRRTIDLIKCMPKFKLSILKLQRQLKLADYLSDQYLKHHILRNFLQPIIQLHNFQSIIGAISNHAINSLLDRQQILKHTFTSYQISNEVVSLSSTMLQCLVYLVYPDIKERHHNSLHASFVLLLELCLSSKDNRLFTLF